MESVDRRHMLLIAAIIVLAQDLSSDSGAHAWSYNYSMSPLRTWDEAREWCQTHFIDMVCVHNPEETAFLNNTIPKLSSYYWIGIHKLAGMWTWVATNMHIPKENQNWATREPDRFRGNDCVEMYIKRGKDTAKWNNENCGRMKGTICYEASCAQDSCSVHGECEETIGNFTCRCEPGFQGRRCDEAISCEPLLDPAHGSHYCFGSYGPSRYNSSCSFHCKLGFNLVGAPQLLCQASGLWSRPAPLCEANGCPALNDTTIGNGNMNCSHPFAPYGYNSTCEVRCDEGYKPVGEERIRCDHTGQWTANVSSCFVKKCPRISFPATGNMTCVDSVMPFSYGSWCNFTCREGFYMTGNNTITCLASERWSEPTPTCTLVNCSSLDVPQHATMQCVGPHGNSSFGSVCTIYCAEGFDRIGPNMTQCSSGGNWSHTLPVCWAKRCPTLNSSAHGSLVCSHPHGAFSFGSRCNSSCEEGFVLNGTADTECTSVGTWSREIPGCLARSCPLLVKPPQHGSVNCTHPHSKFSFASRCDFGCDEGFCLKGTPTITCNSSGNWSQDIPTCQPVQCEPLYASSVLQSMNCSHPLGNFSFASQCAFACKEGYSLNGTETLSCSSAGSWNASLPTCRVEGTPLGTALLLYTGVGAAVALAPLALILLGLLLKRLFTQKGKGVINNAPMWEERENPAFEFD